MNITQNISFIIWLRYLKQSVWVPVVTSEMKYQSEKVMTKKSNIIHLERICRCDMHQYTHTYIHTPNTEVMFASWQ